LYGGSCRAPDLGGRRQGRAEPRTVKEVGLRTAAVATALNVTARAVARVLPLGARLARERDIGLAQLQIDTGEIPSLRCAARLPRLSSA